MYCEESDKVKGKSTSVFFTFCSSTAGEFIYNASTYLPILKPLTWDLSLEEMKLSEIKIVLKIIIA